MSNPKNPTYDLYELQDLLKDPNKRIITRLCFSNASELGICGENEIIEKVLLLKKRDFYKTMQSEKKQGLWQDVYHLSYENRIFYIKLQKAFNGKGVVIQFKLK